MVVISKTTLVNFTKEHPNSHEAFIRWYTIAKSSDWSNFNQLRNDFGSVDAVGNDRYVFNINGNKYRLVALISFKTRTIFILFVGTHQMYDQIEASTIQFKR